jgi:hypothetical protein
MKGTSIMTDDIKTTAIKANLLALDALLQGVVTATGEACAYIEQGERNAAIGSLFSLERAFEQAAAIRDAAIAIHRSDI